MGLFYKYMYKTTDFCGTKHRGTIKTTTKGKDMEQYQEVCRITRSVPNYTCSFLDFVCQFGSYVKGLPKTKRKNLVFGYILGSASVYM